MFYTITEAAKETNISRFTLRNWILAKKLPATKIFGTWRITEETLADLKSGTLERKEGSP